MYCNQCSIRSCLNMYTAGVIDPLITRCHLVPDHLPYDMTFAHPGDGQYGCWCECWECSRHARL